MSFKSGKRTCCYRNAVLNPEPLACGGFIHESQTVESCDLSRIDDGSPLSIGVEAGDLRDWKNSIRLVQRYQSIHSIWGGFGLQQLVCDQCRGKLLLKVMRYNIALLPKKVTNYLVTFYGK